LAQRAGNRSRSTRSTGVSPERLKARLSHVAASMTGTVHGAGMLMTAGFTLPALGFALGPIFHNYTLGWQTVGYPQDFPR